MDLESLLHLDSDLLVFMVAGGCLGLAGQAVVQFHHPCSLASLASAGDLLEQFRDAVMPHPFCPDHDVRLSSLCGHMGDQGDLAGFQPAGLCLPPEHGACGQQGEELSGMLQSFHHDGYALLAFFLEIAQFHEPVAVVCDQGHGQGGDGLVPLLVLPDELPFPVQQLVWIGPGCLELPGIAAPERDSCCGGLLGDDGLAKHTSDGQHLRFLILLSWMNEAIDTSPGIGTETEGLADLLHVQIAGLGEEDDCFPILVPGLMESYADAALQQAIGPFPAVAEGGFQLLGQCQG